MTYRSRLVVAGIVMALVVGMTSTLVISNSSQSRASGLQPSANPSGSGNFPGRSYTWELGPIVTLQNAESGLPFVHLPSYLPSGTTLKEVRMRGQSVALIYSNPSLPRIQEYQDENFSILIVISSAPDSTPSTYEAFLSPPSAQTAITTVTYSNGTVATGETTIPVYAQSTGPIQVFNINGVSGIGWPRGDLNLGGQSVHLSSKLWWWRNGVEYQIAGDFSLDILVQIADSM